MLYNELLQRYAEIKLKKRKESTPSVRIISEKPATPSPRSNVRFTTPRKRQSRIPIYQTPQRTTPTRRRIRLEDIPEFDEEEEEDEPLIPFETPPYTPATSPYFKKHWKRTPVSKRLSGRWERY